MRRIVRSPRSIHDLDEIWLYIARDDPEAAYRTVRRISEATARLPQFPLSGSPIDVPGVRTIPVGRYTIYYTVSPDTVHILRVLHSARDKRRISFD